MNSTDKDREDDDQLTTEVIDPAAPIRFIRLIRNGEELAMIPWDEAQAIADAVENYEEDDTDVE